MAGAPLRTLPRIELAVPDGRELVTDICRRAIAAEVLPARDPERGSESSLGYRATTRDRARTLHGNELHAGVTTG